MAPPRTIGAPATRALRGVDVESLEQVSARRAEDLRLHGVGPFAVERPAESPSERGLRFRD